jgi:hypothetical protein
MKSWIHWVRICAALLAVIALFCCVSCRRSKQAASSEASSESDPEDREARTVYGALAPSRVNASLIFRRNCGASSSDRTADRPRSKPKSEKGEALAQVTSLYPRLSWKEDGKMIRLTDHIAKPALLGVRINQLDVPELHDLEQIAFAIQQTPEVLEFLKTENAEFMNPNSFLGSGTVILGSDGSFHTTYPPGQNRGKRYHFKDATVAEILDQVVLNSSAIWIYEECDSKDGKKISLTVNKY